MIGQTISHYRVVSQLGSGGMGVVYAAEDARLSRQVALKFVSAEAAHDVSTIDRLKAEARTTSALNHPNICTIYDIGEHDGHPFIVMEILKGKTLRERLAAGPLKIHETLDIGIQVTDALVAAHSRGIIHRDIKPANIFLVDQGPVKVLDFGLAKSVNPLASSEATMSPTADLTVAGTTVGTISYMSPEQIGGDPLDRRTDLFSLGVVLYECVTGQQPFQGKTSAVVLASILHQQPTPPTTLNANLPPVVQDVITKCLEKDREFRYQDAEGLRADLKRIRRDLESGALRTGRTESVATLSADPARSGSAVAPIAVERADSGVKSASIAAAAPRNRLPLVAMGVAAVVILGIGAFFILRRPAPSADGSSAAATAQTSAPSASNVGPASVAPADTAPPPASASRPVSPRFDAAIVDANRLLAAGDADGATRALNVARSIDPASPAVADLSARVVELYRSAAARRSASEPARSQPSSGASAPPPSSPSPSALPPASPPPTSASPRAPEPAPNAAPASAPPAASRPAAPESSAVSALPGATLPARPEPVDRRPAPSAAPAPTSLPGAEDEDAAIRRVVATYGRAIETKDLALYRAVKPNLSAAEQKTIEDGFRAVTSQRVTINIQSIEHRGPEAVVRLRRQDVIQAGGRQQTTESQQSLTLVRASNGWVIREIGR